jgi:CBS-domain-containing membrane protein
MLARDVMTTRVVSVRPETAIAEAVSLMLQHHFSGLPVIDDGGQLVGIVTEGDFLRRSETGTERKRPRWLEFVISPRRLADEYVHSHGRKVAEVMTPDPVTVAEDTPLDEVVRLMERRHVKRLPVTRDRRVVGIVSRADLLHALPAMSGTTPAAAASDETIRTKLLAELDRQAWAPIAMITIVVQNGVVEFRGTITDEAQRAALKVAAENMPGVTAVVDNLIWFEPTSGTVIGWGAESGPSEPT